VTIEWKEIGMFSSSTGILMIQGLPTE